MPRPTDAGSHRIVYIYAPRPQFAQCIEALETKKQNLITKASLLGGEVMSARHVFRIADELEQKWNESFMRILWNTRATLGRATKKTSHPLTRRPTFVLRSIAQSI